MNAPARQNQQARIFALQRQQSWLVLLLICFGIVVDKVLGYLLLVAKSFGLGVLLFYVAQSAFTFVAYRHAGVKARQTIMLNMYLGQIIKWLITLVGFAMIFVFAKPMIAVVVVVGYLVMQLACIVVMWYFLR